MMINNMLSTFHKLVKDDPHVPLIFRDVFKDELFRLSMIQVWIVSLNLNCQMVDLLFPALTMNVANFRA